MIRVISVIRVPLMRSLLRTPIAGPYMQLITDLRLGCATMRSILHDDGDLNDKAGPQIERIVGMAIRFYTRAYERHSFISLVGPIHSATGSPGPIPAHFLRHGIRSRL